MSEEKCLQDLPVEVLEMIFDFLGLTDRKLASQVCRLWEELAFSKKLMKNVLLSICFDEGREGLACGRILRNSHREYRHITVEPSDEGIMFIVEKFHNSLSTLTIKADKLVASVKELKELFRYLSGLQELCMLGAVSVNGNKLAVRQPMLPALKTLFLSQNSLVTERFDWRQVAPGVEKLYLMYERDTAKTVYDLLNFYSPNLQQLGLPQPFWFGAGFYDGLGEVTFPKVRKLTAISVRVPSLAQVKRFFDRFTGLIELNYGGARWESESYFYIVRRFPTLTTVRFYDDAPPELFSALSELPQLQHITLINCEVAANRFSESLSKVTELFLKRIFYDDDDDDDVESEPFYQALAVKMPKLIRFGIAAKTEGKTFLPFVYDHLRDLTQLTISLLDDFDLEEAFTKLHQLEKLTDLRLSIVSRFDSFSWLLFPVCPSICRMQIDIPTPYNFSDPEVVNREWKHLAESFPSLVKLQIAARSKMPLSDRQLNSLRTMMPRCSIEIVSKIELFPSDTDDGCRQLEYTEEEDD